MKTVRLTMGQALVKFLDSRYVSFDGEENRFVHEVFGIDGHRCVVGFVEALQGPNHSLNFYQEHKEQGMAHVAIGFAKQNYRCKIMAATLSIRQVALNMVTTTALAMVNRIMVLLLPGDVFACRQPDPVLQQIEHFHNQITTSNDAFEAVCRYWDCIERPDKLLVWP